MTKRIFFVYPIYASFVKNDEALLKKHFAVRSYFFNQSKAALIFSFFRQFFHLLFSFRKYDAYICFFASYSSFLPLLFAKVHRKPGIIILGGTDCVSFPSISYGNFQKPVLAWFTRVSLRSATHLAPVACNLIDCAYTYVDTDFERQGFKNFCRNVTAATTVIYLGYDPAKFFKTAEKIPNSFITVAQMNPANFYRKGIDLIFELATRFPQCTFTIVGNTESMQYDSVPPNIKLLPFIPYEKLRELYSSQQFYLQLSMMEGFPSAPCEAMLCECIPITSNVGALPEIVGETGFILEKKDIALLQEIVVKALASDREKLGLAARIQVTEKFPVTERVKLVEMIKKAIENS